MAKLLPGTGRGTSAKRWWRGLRAGRRAPPPALGGPPPRPGEDKLPAFRPPQKATLVDHVPAGSGWIHEMKYDGYRCELAIAGGRGQNLYPLGPRLVGQVSRDRRGGADAGGRVGPARRRDRQPGRQGQVRLLRAPAGDRRGRPRPHPVPVRRARDRRRGSDEASEHRAQGAARRAASATASRRPSSTPSISSAMARNCSTRCARPARKGSSRRAPTRPIAATGRRAGSRSNAPTARNSSSSAGRKATRRAAASAPCSSASTRAASCAMPARSAPASRCRSSTICARGWTGSRPTSRRPRCPRAEARGAHWVKPELVAEIAFAEFTADNVVRHASFLGLRGDKDASEVVPEKPQPVAARGRRRDSDQQSGAGRLSRREGHQGRARRLFPRRRAAHAPLGREPAADPGPLPAGPGEEMLLPEARRRHVRAARPPCPDRGEEGRDRGLSLHRQPGGPARLRPDGGDRVPRLGQPHRRRREAGPDRLRHRPGRGAQLRGGEEGGARHEARTSPTWACRPFRCSPAARASTSSCR